MIVSIKERNLWKDVLCKMSAIFPMFMSLPRKLSHLEVVLVAGYFCLLLSSSNDDMEPNPAKFSRIEATSLLEIVYHTSPVADTK